MMPRTFKTALLAFGVAAWAGTASAWSYSPTSKTVTVNGGSFTLTVSGTEYYDWTAGASEDWITVTRIGDKTF